MSFGSRRTSDTAPSPRTMNGMPISHGPTRPCASIARWAKSGPNSTGPQIAPVTEPNRTNDMPRARRSGGNISAAVARVSWIVAPAPPSMARPTATSTADGIAQPPATTPHPTAPTANAPRITGIRPTLSVSRPAGPTASAPDARKIAGPRPRIPVIPVTATSVSELSAAASWNMPELKIKPPARSTALRRMGSAAGSVLTLSSLLVRDQLEQRAVGVAEVDARADSARAGARRWTELELDAVRPQVLDRLVR